MKEDDIIHIIKLTDEEAAELYQQGVPIEKIRKMKRYTISRKDYNEMIEKRNAQGDTSKCICGHTIYEHKPSRNIYSYPAGKCDYRKCRCRRYLDESSKSVTQNR